VKLAVVERLTIGLDGHVRAADIRTASGKTDRSIACLASLEVNENKVQEAEGEAQRVVSSTDMIDDSVSNSSDHLAERPTRNATIRPHYTDSSSGPQ